MLKGSLQAENYPDWLDRIESLETRSAFVCLVGLAACCRSLICHAHLKGENGPVHAVYFHDEHGEHPFSFIVNKQKPLLFYFRAPATRSPNYTLAELQSAFSGTKIPRAEEWTVPIATTADAWRLWEFLNIK